MEITKIVEQLRPWIEQHKRSAWKPVVQDRDSELTASKLSGTPWIAKDDSWPTCKSCHRPLQLFLQLNLAHLPKPLQGKFGDGLLQLFYCTGDLGETCEYLGGWEPFSDYSSLTRIVQPVGTALETTIPQEPGYYPPKSIVEWEEIMAYPHPMEHDELGLEYIYDWDIGTVTLKCSELGLKFEDIKDDYLAETISTSAVGDKLAGWPHWVQDVEYPYCPICNTKMVYIFQVDSKDNLPYVFGDLGTGHITQCPNHKEVVTFGWACS